MQMVCTFCPLDLPCGGIGVGVGNPWLRLYQRAYARLATSYEQRAAGPATDARQAGRDEWGHRAYRAADTRAAGLLRRYADTDEGAGGLRGPLPDDELDRMLQASLDCLRLARMFEGDTILDEDELRSIAGLRVG